MEKLRIYEVSTAHLDTVWNWTLEDSVKRFLVNTFTLNLGYMDKYPHYRFNFEGAYRYDLIKEYYPDAYEKMRERINEGRWMVTGSSWENGDVVTPEPETLMRNILYGNLYFEEEFGKISNDIFLPDCFGFPWTLPTIMHHMGLTAFSSQKLEWNPPHAGRPPFHVGRWMGIDGSEIIASINPGPYARNIKVAPRENVELQDMVAGLPLCLDMRYYGTGDQGGAPSEESIAFVNEAVAQNGPAQRTEFISAYAGQIADELTEEEKAQLPVHNGDFLMVTHGVGSYSSVAPTKRFHRSNEMKADVAEKLNVMGEWLGVKDYPRAVLRKLWCDFIRHEFHDDLTGTSVARAYRETFHDDIVVNNRLDGEIGAAFCALTAAIDTSACGTDALVVFNPCAAQRRALVSAKLPYGKKKAATLSAVAADGTLCPTQMRTEKDGSVTLLFVADLPSTGYATFSLRETAAAASTLSVTASTLENGRYRVTLNENGDIASVYDKKYDREILSAPIHFELQRNNYVHYGSWEITYDDEVADPYAVVSGPAVCEIVENGPARIALKVTRYYHASKFEQTLSLDASDGALRVDNVVVWNELSTLLKCAFPLNLTAETARFDRGLGSVECPDRNPALYEVPVHKWANLYDSTADYSATIVNDCKYGMDKNGSVLRLTCIHTPNNRWRPDSRQDLQDFGRNEFAFAVSGDRGDFVAAHAEEQGIAFNQQPLSVLTDAHAGTLPPVYAFVSVSPCLSLKAVKKAEGSDEYIVRVVESTGAKQADVSIAVGDGIESVRPVNGYEKPVSDATLTLSDGKLHFAIGAFEPKSFAIKLKNPAKATAKTQYYPVSLDLAVPFTSSDEHRGEYGFGPENTTVPRKLMNKDFRVCDVPLSLTECDGQFTCAYAAGQQLPVPQGTDVLYLMAARTGDDAPYTVLVDGNPVSVNLQSYTDDIGGWDQYAANHRGFIRENRVAFCASHVHDTTGDRVYGRFTWYLIPVSLPVGAKAVTLPADNGVILAAATFAAAAVPASMVTDIALHKEQPQKHRLTVVGGSGSGEYYSETPLHICVTANHAEQIVWHATTGETFTGAEIGYVMPDCDVTLTAERIGAFAREILPQPSVFATSDWDAAHATAHILDGRDDTCWVAGKDHAADVTFDFGVVEPLSHIVLMHAGTVLGDMSRNTVDFAADYFDGSAWQPLFAVQGNATILTQHSFATVMTQFVRLRMLCGGISQEDSRAALARAWFYADKAPAVLKKENVSVYDLGEPLSMDETLYHGLVTAGQRIVLPNTVAVRHWHLQANAAVLSFLDENGNCLYRDEGRDVVTPHVVNRAMPQTYASAILVESVDADDAEKAPILTLTGAACPLPVLREYLGIDIGGSRNPGVVKREDGSLLLPACDGEHHDMYGFRLEVPGDTFALSVKVRIPADELANAADDTPLFCFNPFINYCDEPKGRFFTVADYKAAMTDANGYRVLFDTFTSSAHATVEGRMWNKRHLTLEVATFSYCGKSES